MKTLKHCSDSQVQMYKENSAFLSLILSLQAAFHLLYVYVQFQLTTVVALGFISPTV